MSRWQMKAVSVSQLRDHSFIYFKIFCLKTPLTKIALLQHLAPKAVVKTLCKTEIKIFIKWDSNQILLLVVPLTALPASVRENCQHLS